MAEHGHSEISLHGNFESQPPLFSSSNLGSMRTKNPSPVTCKASVMFIFSPEVVINYVHSKMRTNFSFSGRFSGVKNFLRKMKKREREREK